MCIVVRIHPGVPCFCAEAKLFLGFGGSPAGNMFCLYYDAPISSLQRGTSFSASPVPVQVPCLVLGRVCLFTQLGPPVVPFLTSFLGEGSSTQIEYRKKGYPYSNLFTGGPGQISMVCTVCYKRFY